MNLEDHAGDVIRKARAMSNVSPEAAAQAAGMTPAELAALEDSGQSAKKPDVAALAKLIGVDAKKLEAQLAGWHPNEPDLGTWREFRQITTSGDGMTVNCYLAWDEVSREAALFDTGFEAKPINDLVEEHKLQLKHIFITHTHPDHIAALPEIRAKYPKARMHWSAKDAAVAERNRANDFIQLGSLRITNRDTPGHADDGVTYIIGTWPDDAPHVAIVGDAIFSASMGRGNQSWDVAKQKVREQILSLPAETLICPGHGPVTTVGEEKQFNPFF